MKAKSKNSTSRRSLGLYTALLLCTLFFLAGLFFSTLFSQGVPPIRSRQRRIELGEVGAEVADVMPHGETGEGYIESIPFQILSWKPRALYFPNFATAEQCQTIIERAKVNLKPSTLALRKGETAENTKGTRTSSGTFLSASEEKTGVLDFIEKKIAKATSIPRSHGEVHYLFLGKLLSDHMV
ncbi:hypothetical protein SLEP1_g57188 [Rubroshorea leprosula]|uniref:Prolyl 4-hydroxylase 9 n=1 Tax=Rubroshorea leprosula TaxID=152421 RepID=A0AAV5MP15_9ROSI|nr:hypothetical protein SLEP1_g57188 [Rubroshorea leprosula]